MKKSKKTPSIDVQAWLADVQGQFQNLDPKDPSLWPVVPKFLLCLVITAGVVAGAWYGYLSSLQADLEAAKNQETTLRQEYSTKLAKAVGLDALKAQRELVQQYVVQLEKQLPSKAEMAALLSDVNHAGMGRGLQFDLFRPGSESIKEYYAELPITVRVSGQFHDMGSFVSDVAHLSRIVTLNNISIEANAKGGGLVLDTQARTYRYLDPEETAASRRAEAAQKGRKK
ncbi:MAG: type 4a pilus biogenesis protein PilO [Comamonas sp.]|jgi:type IV pilus assembly protein PilO|nr:type 4a pilus biogenesis protein PilO [Comamonas sp.]